MYDIKKIRNFSIIAHIDHGKSTLADRLLEYTGAVEKRNIEEQLLDNMDIERERGITILAKNISVNYKGVKINVIDTPGYLDFSGEVLQALRVADSAIITVDGKAGIEVGTELAWDYAEAAGLPRAFFINKCDDPDADFDKVFEQLRSEFGNVSNI